MYFTSPRRCSSQHQYVVKQLESQFLWQDLHLSIATKNQKYMMANVIHAINTIQSIYLILDANHIVKKLLKVERV